MCVPGEEGRAGPRQHPQRVHISAEVTPGVVVHRGSNFSNKSKSLSVDLKMWTQGLVLVTYVPLI